MNKKFSIIVPVYNVEKYLRKCIDSILNQTYKNFELIIVDDGSTDCSGNICDEYKLKNENIIVIHKKNGGLSSARDTGISKVTGEYIIFVDSDDWIEPNTLEVLNNIVSKREYDMIIYGIFMDYYAKEVKTEEISLPTKSYNSVQRYLDEFEKYRISGLFGYVCNKLYRSEVIKLNKIEFGEYVYPEDVYFNFKVLPKCNNILVIENIFYHYIHRSRETLSKAKRDTLKITNQMYDNTIDFLKNNNSYEINERYIQTSYLECIISYIVNEISREKDLNKRLKRIYKDYRVRNALDSYDSNIKFFRIMYIFMKYNMIKSSEILLKLYNIYIKFNKKYR